MNKIEMNNKFDIYDTVRIKQNNKVSYITDITGYITKSLTRDGKVFTKWSIAYMVNDYTYKTFTEEQLELYQNKPMTNLQFHSLMDDINLKFRNFDIMKRTAGSAAYQGEQEKVKVESAESSNDKEGINMSDDKVVNEDVKVHKCDCGEQMFAVFFKSDLTFYRCLKCDVIKDIGELNK